jgi:hypothetical protein
MRIRGDNNVRVKLGRDVSPHCLNPKRAPKYVNTVKPKAHDKKS